MIQDDKYYTAWREAWRLLRQFEEQPRKGNELIEAASAGLDVAITAPLRHHLMGVWRDYLFLQEVLAKLVTKRPRAGLRALLLLALHELLTAAPERAPKVIDFAVGQARKELSVGEARMVNAVLRGAVPVIEKFLPKRVRLNHPRWLLQRWQANLGPENAIRLMEWNQQPSPVYMRCAAADRPEGAEETAWKGFYRIDHLTRETYLPLLISGKGYIQDPMTRWPVELLQASGSDQVLDLCAAPGGKSCWLRSCLGPAGKLVAVDLPGQRSKRLKENLERAHGAPYQVVEVDVLSVPADGWKELAGVQQFDAILLDVPCSNTGVIRRKPDVRVRLKESDIAQSAAFQLKLLQHSAPWVKPGGRIVYSTCSIEPEENEQVVTAFLAAHPDFELVRSEISHPWVHHHDGGGAFLLRRTNQKVSS